MNLAAVASLIKAQGLPEEFLTTVTDWYLPLVRQIVAKMGTTPFVLGVQGCQGSGKSTLALFLKLLAEQEHGLNTICLSLDDFYLTRAERKQLSDDIHPLFSTRGVPGTHDIPLAINTITRLRQASDQEAVSIPRFNKATDDRFETSEWDNAQGNVDLIIFEGWCTGCDAQDENDLVAPINKLEEDEDQNGHWRTYVNNQLDGLYADLFSLLDALVVLQAPSFECVYEWRWLQEQKLVEATQKANSDAPVRTLDEQGVRRFISHYERLTRHCLNTLPKKADWVLTLNKEHNITEFL